MDRMLNIKNYLEMMINTCNNIDYNEIIAIYEILVKTNDAGGKIYICGNGGSASTAQHFQADLNKAFSIVRSTMPAVCLTDNLAAITAIANDESYADVFRYQLQYLLHEKDVLITISGSGNSVNIVKAAEYAKEKGNTVIAIVGYDGGKLKTLSDYVFLAAVNHMQVAEDIHLMFCHIVSVMIRESVEEINDYC